MQAPEIPRLAIKALNHGGKGTGEGSVGMEDVNMEGRPSTADMDDELSLPRGTEHICYLYIYRGLATVYKLITEMLPSGVGCSKETRDMLVDCCNEFVHLISSEANDICEKSGRKTISPEHVLESLKTLGFTDYLEGVQQAHDEHTEQHKEKERIKASSKAEAAKLSEEELLRQQEELFQAARLKYQQKQMATAESVPDQLDEPVEAGEKSEKKIEQASSTETLSISD